MNTSKHIAEWLRDHADTSKDANGYYSADVLPPDIAFVWAWGQGWKGITSLWIAMYVGNEFRDERDVPLKDVTHWQFAEIPPKPEGVEG